MVTLVKRGAPHETETEGGVTACIRAVLNSDKACLRQLVEAGADINYASRKTGYSPLAWACRRGDLVMCHSVLATDEVSPGIPGPTGITPIMAAAAAGQKEPCNILDEWVLEHGVAGALETEVGELPEQAREVGAVLRGTGAQPALSTSCTWARRRR